MELPVKTNYLALIFPLWRIENGVERYLPPFLSSILPILLFLVDSED